MAARPPVDDDGDEVPESLAFGISALDARLSNAELAFPATDDELVRALDDPNIPYNTAGQTLSLSAALDRVDERRFESQSELQNVLHPVFEAERRQAGIGLVGRVRSLLPF